MRDQPTLAEILSDNAGNIRPEVADILMEPQPVPRRQRRRRGWRWIVFGMIALLTVFALEHRKVFNTFSDTLNKRPTMAERSRPATADQTIQLEPATKAKARVHRQPIFQDEKIHYTREPAPMPDFDIQWGWFKAVLPDGHIDPFIGAYPIPKNSISRPSKLAIAKDGKTRLLVREREDDPLYYDLIKPDGRLSRILKDEVTLY